MPRHPHFTFIEYSLLRCLLPVMLSVFLVVPNDCLAQQKLPLTQDSVRLFEFEISRDLQQRKIDSIEKINLLQKLDSAQKNSARARELEIELQRINKADSTRKKQQEARIEQMRKTVQGHPVAPFGDTLFWVNVKLGSRLPKERAEQIEQRINQLYEGSFFSSDSLSVEKTDLGHEVIYRGGQTILVVSELDALWYHRETEDLAKEYAKKLGEAVTKERNDNSLLNWLKRLGLVLLIIAGAIILILLVNSGFRKLRLWLFNKRDRFFKGITLGKIPLLSPSQQTSFILKAINIARLIIIIFGIYLCLPLLFIIFPGTEAITDTLIHWVVSPAKKLLQGIVDFMPDLFTIVVIYFFTNAAVRAVSYFATQLEKGQMNIPGFHPEFAKPTFNIVRFVLYAFMLVLIFPYLPGSDSPAFQGVSVFLGVLLSLGSSSAINNIIAGLVITYMRPFQVGDRVKIGDFTGDVIEKTMLVIKLRTIKNEEITVPNSTILTSNTVNYSAQAISRGLVIYTTVTIGYDVPWKKMHDALITAALRCDKVLKTPEPFVWQTSLDDFYVSYQLNAYINNAQGQNEIRSEIHQHIQDCCREAGIEIMSPHYRSHRSGEESTIPAE